MNERIFGLPRNIFLLGLTSLFNDFSSEMVYSVFPAFFISVLGTGAASLGFIDGIAEAASSFFKIYSGNLSDRFQKRKPLVVAGYSLSVLTRPLYALAATVPATLVLRFLDRAGKGIRDSARDAIISLSTSKDRLGYSFGYHRTMDTIGAILGPLVAYLILRNFPSRFNFVFLAAFGVGVIALLTLFFIKDVIITAQTKPARLIAAFNRFSLGFKLYLIATLILSTGSLPVAVILLKTVPMGLTIADIPLFYMIYNLSYACFSMSAGALSDRIGPRTVIVTGYVVLLMSYLLLDTAISVWPLAFGFLAFGLFPALTDGVQRAFASSLTSEDLRGSGLGWFNAANGFGALTAGIGGGYLWQTHSPATAFLAASVTIVVGLVLFFASAARRTSSSAQKAE